MFLCDVAQAEPDFKVSDTPLFFNPKHCCCLTLCAIREKFLISELCYTCMLSGMYNAFFMISLLIFFVLLLQILIIIVPFSNISRNIVPFLWCRFYRRFYISSCYQCIYIGHFAHHSRFTVEKSARHFVFVQGFCRLHLFAGYAHGGQWILGRRFSHRMLCIFVCFACECCHWLQINRNNRLMNWKQTYRCVF